VGHGLSGRFPAVTSRKRNATRTHPLAPRTIPLFPLNAATLGVRCISQRGGSSLRRLFVKCRLSRGGWGAGPIAGAFSDQTFRGFAGVRARIAILALSK